ncbi:FAD-binding oxidoreductase [Aliifodinibius sp. S!AR15-10]|uniref:FAD-binding oxidoreductase n=1 Tax=Aliifodinibius sp. S!AR15-10 TaxID=2950437 RepID=UPI00285A4239|nr:FAD-binding oxidoreductase [Aliifodinibius sp. S!AR15-10]MDR8392191.1 FAD-binding oxidoreductase [Aliifodinibius sp. S!AR15-10]
MELVQAATLDAKKVKLSKENLEELSSHIRGEIVTPDSKDYDEARSIYNGMVDKKPSLIVYCSDVADVKVCVNFAREYNLLTSVRGGGHNGPGLALCEEGMVIDLSGLKGIRVDPRERTVRAEAGCTWGDVDHATHAFGLATVSGIISTTGIAGLTLGGGHGYLSRKYGLTVDNLLEADVVLPDGRFVTANQNQHSDLFWALRGGGGNFGIVTSFKYCLHPVDTIVGGPMFWPIAQTEKIMQWYLSFITDVPEDVYAFFLTAEVPGDPFPPKLHGEKVCGLVWCITSSTEEAEPFLQQAREVEEPIFEHVSPMPYPMLQAAFDGIYPEGLQWYWKGDFIRELSDEAISEHLNFAEVPTTRSTMHMYPINGKVHEMGVDETAWSYRDVNWSMVIAGVSSDPAEKEKIMNWARDYWEATHPYSAGAAYVNFMMEEGDDRVKATYGENYERLQKIKAKYDPDNFLRKNQNISPKK